LLILTRKIGETIDITLEDGRRIEVAFLGVKGNQSRVGITAPKTVVVDRSEITQRKSNERDGNGNV